MKKSILSLLVLATSLVACTGDYKDWADLQSTPQPATASFGDGSVTEVNLIDFDDEAVAASEMVKVCEIVAPTSTVASFSTPVYKLTLGEGETAAEFAVTKDGKVSTSDLKAFIENVYGKKRVERDVPAELVQWVTDGTTNVKNATADFNVKVILPTSKYADFIYYVGTGNGWKETEDGTHPRLALQNLDNGTYTGYIYQVEESYGNTFRFLTALGGWEYAIGTDVFTTMTGDVEAASSDNNFSATKGTGIYYVEACMDEGTIKLTKIDYMGVTGDFTGWNEGIEMTWNATDWCYEADAAVTAAGWKFRANGKTDTNWTVNLGANDSTEPSTIISDLCQGGKNIGVAGSKVKLYPCRTTNEKIYCTVE